MAILGTVGIADKGTYNASETYVEGNFVLYEGSTWLALKDNLTGVTPEEGENWKYLARGFGSDNLSQILGTDTSGVIGATGAEVVSQALIDAIADKVMTKLIPYANIVNHFLATDPETVLSGPMGKSLKDQLDTTNSNLTSLNSSKANKTDVHNLKGINPVSNALVTWASDDAKRLSIWKISGNNATGFPDDSAEWCTLNLQDNSGTRGIIVAFKFSSTATGVKYRCYANGAWSGDWKTIV